MSYLDAKPTVGRIVHFYNEANPDSQCNGIGKGPFAAIITQVFQDNTYVNLKIVPYGVVWDEGSVSKGEPGSGRYWCWPPREV